VRPDRIVSQEGPRPTELETARRRHAAHCHAAPGFLSRRQFLQTAAGATALGVATASGLLRPGVAHAAGPGIGQVLPIPTTLEIFPGEEFHLQAPPFTGANSDPSTVYNFQGSAGIALISGSVERTDRKTGQSRTLPYSFNDMRFMKGVFRGRDGHVRDGTFALV
jgi:hypothetical protein